VSKICANNTKQTILATTGGCNQEIDTPIILKLGKITSLRERLDSKTELFIGMFS
jgi:hypothetical protein